MGARAHMSTLAELIGLIVADAWSSRTCSSRCCARSASEAMTVAGWIEIRLFAGGPDRAHPARRRATWRASSAASSPALDRRRAARRVTACSASTRQRGQDWKGYARSVLICQRRSSRAACSTRSCARRASTRGTRATWSRARGTCRSTRPRRSSRTRTGSSTAARRRCRTSPDGRPGGAELRLGRRRHRRRHRGHPRPRLALGQGDRQSSTSTSPARSSTSCCRSRPGRARARVPGRHADAQGTTTRRRSGGHADVPRRPGRRPGGDQAARHQRRRLLQRQLGDAVREPDLALELRRDARDPRSSRRR